MCILRSSIFEYYSPTQMAKLRKAVLIESPKLDFHFRDGQLNSLVFLSSILKV